MYCHVLLQAREASGSDFTYGFIMIDKAKAEMAAVRLLEETSLTASEIAQQCGFVDASSFTQHFRKRMGESPVAYRRLRT